jgi:hypothetical protein
MKTDVRVLFVVFYSYIETVFLHKNEKLLGAKDFTVSAICSSAYIIPMVHFLPDALQHVLCNICNCCSDPYFEFIHSLAVHMVFHIAQRKKFKGLTSGE